MNVIPRRSVLVAWAGAVAGMLATPALALAYPTRPATIIVPGVPGSTYEPMLRYVSNELTKRQEQPIVIEYKPGAGQTIGAQIVRNAKPDAKILKTPEANKALAAAVSGDLLATTPQELRLYETEIRLYGDATKLVNFKPE